MPKTMLFKILVVCVSARPVFAEELATPAGRNSGEPNLVVAADDELYLSWGESKNDRATLQFSTWNGSKWTSPNTVSSGKDWFVNWADFPSLCALEDGTCSLTGCRCLGSQAKTVVEVKIRRIVCRRQTSKR